MQVHHRIHHAHKHELVTRVQALLWRHHGKDFTVAMNLHEIAAGQVAQAGVFDAAAYQRAFAHQHFECVATWVVGYRGASAARRQEQVACEYEIKPAYQRTWHADFGDFKHANVAQAGIKRHTVHNQVGA